MGKAIAEFEQKVSRTYAWVDVGIERNGGIEKQRALAAHRCAPKVYNPMGDKPTQL